jgi:TonB family protein
MRRLLAATILFAVRLCGQSALDHIQQADTLKSQGNNQSAANEYRAAIDQTLDPALQVRAHLGLAAIFETSGQHDRALDEMHLIERLQSKASLQRALPTGVYRAGKDATKPEPIESKEPEYTAEARLAELEGTVQVSGIVGIDGILREIRIDKSIGLGLDEKAVEAVATWRFRPGTFGGKPVPVMTTVPVEFRMTAKMSRWHLTGVTFKVPQGVVRPYIVSPSFPSGAGVATPAAIEEGWVLWGIRRQAEAVVAFDIDESGVPVHLSVESVSADVWAPEALSVVRGWRFKPGMKEDDPVPVPCKFTLTWGGRRLGVN